MTKSNPQREISPVADPIESEQGLGPIMTKADNLLFAMAQPSETASTPAVEIADELKVSSRDNSNRPIKIEYKPEIQALGSSTLENIKYDGPGNKVSSFNFTMNNPPDAFPPGTFKYRFEKSPDGSWTTYVPDSEGKWTKHNTTRTGRPEIDLGDVSISEDKGAHQVNIHATGLDAGVIGSFVKNDGFMTDTAIQNMDPLSVKMQSIQTIEALVQSNHEREYSQARLQEILAEHEANSKLPEGNNKGINPKNERDLCAAYKAVIDNFKGIGNGKPDINLLDLVSHIKESGHTRAAEMVAQDLVTKTLEHSFPKEGLEWIIKQDPKTFEKIAKGKKEISVADLTDYKHELENGAIALAIANTVAKTDKLTYPAEALITTVFGRIDPFLLMDNKNVKSIEEGINKQLKSSVTAGDYSIRFDPNLRDHKPTPADEGGFAFASPQKDRLLEIMKNGKLVGRIPISTRTDVITIEQP